MDAIKAEEYEAKQKELKLYAQGGPLTGITWTTQMHVVGLVSMPIDKVSKAIGKVDAAALSSVFC